VKDVALPPTLAAVGEISLAGEIRPVAAARQRLGEAKRLGYTQVVDGDAGSVHSAIGIAFAAAPDRSVPAF
jgi:DNA repair protein RadA/Sms